jgi:hypothetical protein
MDYQRKRYVAFPKGTRRSRRAGSVHFLGSRKLGQGTKRDDGAICRFGGKISSGVCTGPRTCAPTDRWSTSSIVTATWPINSSISITYQRSVPNGNGWFVKGSIPLPSFLLFCQPFALSVIRTFYLISRFIVKLVLLYLTQFSGVQ